MSEGLRARMRAVFRPKLSNSAKAPYGRYAVDSAKENAVTSRSGCYGVLSKEINAVTLVRPCSANKAGLRENTLCSVCRAGGDLWTLDTPTGPVTVHEECSRFLSKPEPAGPTAAYRAASSGPDGCGAEVTIVDIPATGLRYRRTFAHLQLRPPAYIPEDRWRMAIEDGRTFLHQWGEQAQALGWVSRDLFGLHAPPERPHPSYWRLSRYDATGLIWLLQGRDVIALTAEGAVIRTATAGILTYYRHGRPAYGPIGDSALDIDPRWGGIDVAQAASQLVASLLGRPRYSGQTHFRAVHRDQVGHRGERPDQANRDHDGDSHHPYAHLHPLYVALSLPIGLAYFSPPQREVVHGCAKFFEARAEEGKRNGNERANGPAR